MSNVHELMPPVRLSVSPKTCSGSVVVAIRSHGTARASTAAAQP
jgi:hypothetical protein